MPCFHDQSEHIDQEFKNIDLEFDEVHGVLFENCLFKNSHFSGTQFKQCKFIECTWTDCNLSTASFMSTLFNDTTFEDCKLIGIDWTKALWPKIKLCSPLKFIKCVLNDSSFFGLSLEELMIVECKAMEVDFREANLTKANFSYTDFENSLFNDTNLTKADFTEAINYNIDIFFNKIKQAKFSLPEATNLLRSLDIELIESV